MTSQKPIDSPLVTSYTIAVLTQDYTDRMFVALDQYRNRLVWSRKYRPAVVYETQEKAVIVMDEIKGGHHPQLIEEKAGVDLSTMCVLETNITFRVLRAKPASGTTRSTA